MGLLLTWWKIQKNVYLSLFLPLTGFSTKAIHCGNEPDPKFGGVSPAIDLSTTFY